MRRRKLRTGALCTRLAAPLSRDSARRRRPRCRAAAHGRRRAPAARPASSPRLLAHVAAARSAPSPRSARSELHAPQRAPGVQERARRARGSPRRSSARPHVRRTPAMAGRSSTASARASASASSSRAPRRRRRRRSRAAPAHIVLMRIARFSPSCAAQIERRAHVGAARVEVPLRARQAAHVVERQGLAARGPRAARKRSSASSSAAVACAASPVARAVQARLLSA